MHHYPNPPPPAPPPNFCPFPRIPKRFLISQFRVNRPRSCFFDLLSAWSAWNYGRPRHLAPFFFFPPWSVRFDFFRHFSASCDLVRPQPVRLPPFLPDELREPLSSHFFFPSIYYSRSVLLLFSFFTGTLFSSSPPPPPLINIYAQKDPLLLRFFPVALTPGFFLGQLVFLNQGYPA